MTTAPLPTTLAGAAVRPHYSRPPIVEVVSELRVEPLEPSALEPLRRFRTDDSGRYPIEETIHTSGIEVEFEATGGKPPRVAQSSEQLGYSFRAVDRTQLVQVRRNGISYHRLAPYTHWEDCFEETKRLWARFLEIVSPGPVVQLGLRYVNRILLPAPCELKDFLRTFPEVSPNLPQLISGYVMQLSLPQPDLPGTVLVARQALVPPPDPTKACVLMDNDIICKRQLLPTDDSIWRTFESLHTRQNVVFEGCITDATRELFN